MRDELRKEYEKILIELVMAKGYPTWMPGTPRSRYAGPTDYTARSHVTQCEIVSTGKINEEYTWTEFSGTFASTGASHRYGIALEKVTCKCGELIDRKILWEATYPEVAAAVFEKMYQMLSKVTKDE